MFRREGFTLIEILVVLIIIGLALAFYFPNFTASDEKAWAINAQNNLLAIYSAEQNYNNNNNGGYCLDTGLGTCGHSLADLNTNLSLNIQDDGAYLYDCGVTTANACTAKRTSISPPNTIVLTLTSAINLSGTGTANPQCNLTNNWCPA